MRPAASCAGTDSHTTGAADHELFHRAATEENGWNLRAHVRCLFVSTASCPNRRLVFYFSWHGSRRAVRRGSASPLPRASLHSPHRRLLPPAPVCLLFCRLDLVRQCLPCFALSYWLLAVSSCFVVQSFSSNFFVIRTAGGGCGPHRSFFVLRAAVPHVYFFVLPAAAF